MSQPALIIDDNDDYAALLLGHLEPRGFHFDRARSAREGLEILNQNGVRGYRLIVTDITMEGQTAGLKLIRQIRQLRYRGVLMVASTGFNSRLVLHLSRVLMSLWGVDVLVPKDPLKRGRMQCLKKKKKGKLWQAFQAL